MSSFPMHARVFKHSGSWWEGKVVGYYKTEDTPFGVCVQLDHVPHGAVQIYPARALHLCKDQNAKY